MAAGDSLLVLKLLWPYYSYSKYNTRAAEEGGSPCLCHCMRMWICMHECMNAATGANVYER